MKQYARNAIVGKTVKAAKEDTYGTVIEITFTDNTVLTITPGQTGIHNDRWSIVYMELKDAVTNTD